MSEVNGFEGEGWYTFGWSDGEEATDGAVWIEDAETFAGWMPDDKSEFRLALSTYYGDDRFPSEFITIDPHFLDSESWRIWQDVCAIEHDEDAREVYSLAHRYGLI